MYFYFVFYSLQSRKLIERHWTSVMNNLFFLSFFNGISKFVCNLILKLPLLKKGSGITNPFISGIKSFSLVYLPKSDHNNVIGVRTLILRCHRPVRKTLRHWYSLHPFLIVLYCNMQIHAHIYIYIYIYICGIQTDAILTDKRRLL